MVTAPTPGQSRHGYHINFAKQPLTSNCSPEKVLQVLRVSNVGKATQSMSPPVRDTAAEVGYFVFIIRVHCSGTLLLWTPWGPGEVRGVLISGIKL